MNHAVVSAAGSSPGIIRDSVDGLLTPPGDAAALADALELLADDGALRVRLGQAAILRVQQEFSVEAMVEQYARFLDRAWSYRHGVKR